MIVVFSGRPNKKLTGLYLQQASLDKGMDTLSQAEVGSALQIYFNLQELPEVLSLCLLFE